MVSVASDFDLAGSGAGAGFQSEGSPALAGDLQKLKHLHSGAGFNLDHLAADDAGQYYDTETGEVFDTGLLFEELLIIKLANKTQPQQRSLRSQYRKAYRESGLIPAALLHIDGRKAQSGRKASLPAAIAARFIEKVRQSADKAHTHFATKDTRKISMFHYQLEREFKAKIDIRKLYTLAKKAKLKNLLEKPDGEAEIKEPSFFKAEPVGDLVQMDGVTSDYFEIKINDKWIKPVFIEFFDYGSRKLLAMHGYPSESNESSVDIFNRFLGGNTFAKKRMKLRPDNAKAFLNLRRCITEMNRRYARGGFVLIDDFARVGTPQDKAHLESSHRAFHAYEQVIISHFRDREVERVEQLKKTGNAMRTVTVVRLDITLAELNGSGLLDEYRQHHNGKPHRFTEDGRQTVWVPDERWDAHLAAHETFAFAAADLELNRIYGYSKQSGTIARDGTVTYKGRRYNVSDTQLFNRAQGTKIMFSVVSEGKLALFNNAHDGVYLGDALALKAPVKPERVVDKELHKEAKGRAHGLYKDIEQRLFDAGLSVNADKLHELIGDGLTLELTAVLLQTHGKRYAQHKHLAFFAFCGDAKAAVADNRMRVTRNVG